jgi:hypothetical protein
LSCWNYFSRPAIIPEHGQKLGQWWRTKEFTLIMVKLGGLLSAKAGLIARIQWLKTPQFWLKLSAILMKEIKQLLQRFRLDTLMHIEAIIWFALRL